ncbi:hypothetical protein HMN09_01091300 [Mycena chlorophos]|uniref:Uncharacterized protein n=1 Tax=Mycena chlorophos TaxID=658473 RepID=A0A8H6VZP8_MYCCL|nr:hypothetical protein HMN09_01091300 [Mycena chlorophos]
MASTSTSSRTSSGSSQRSSTQSATSSATSNSNSNSSVPFFFPQTFNSSTPAPTSSGSGNGTQQTNGNGSGSWNPIGGSAKLYLYTFLATLIVLLGVSSAIVFRSLMLRRRHQRMLEEAIANGTWVPPAQRGKVDLRKKPRMWDAWMAPPTRAGVVGEEADEVKGGGRTDEWGAVMPFAASYIPPATVDAAPSTIALASTTTTPAPTAAAADILIEPPRVRVAVLIAMPIPELFASPSPPTHTPASSTPTSSGSEPQRPEWLAPFSVFAADGQTRIDEDDVMLPPVQMGVVVVGVVPSTLDDGDCDGIKEESGDGDGAGAR